MTAHFDFFHAVRDDEIDAQQHVHNLRYLQWTLWAARDHSAASGWEAAAALQQGLGWVVRSHEVTYRAAAVAGDEVVVRTWVSDLNRFSSRRKYSICRPSDRTVLGRVETRWVYVDLNVHKVVPIPEDVAALITVSPQAPPLPWDEIKFARTETSR